jgi:hypothetical protein
VEVAVLQSKGQQEAAGAGGAMRAAGKGGAEAGEEERHAVLTYVLKALDEHLLTELLEGLPF